MPSHGCMWFVGANDGIKNISKGREIKEDVGA